MDAQHHEQGLDDRNCAHRGLEEGPSHPGHKKGSEKQCTNNCGISLLSIPGKFGVCENTRREGERQY